MPVVTAPFNIGNTLAQAEQIKGARSRNALMDQQAAALSANQDREAALRNALAAGDLNTAAQLDPVGTQQFQQAEQQYSQRQLAIATERATILGRVGDQVRNSKDPIQTARFVLPMLSEAGINLGITPDQIAQMDPEEVRQVAAALSEQSSAFLQEQNKTIREGLDDQGNPAFVGIDPRTLKATPIQGVRPKPQRPGTSLTVGPDGSVSFTEGGSTPIEPTSPVKSKLQETVIQSQAGIDRLNRIGSSFKPEFLQLDSKLKAGWSALKDKSGLEALKLGPGEAKFLDEYTTFQTDTLQNLNRYIKEITGAAMSAAEAERIIKGLPSAADGPTQFVARFKSSMRELKMVQARAHYTLRNGIKIDDTPISSMESIIDARGAELKKQLGSQFSGDELNRAIINQLTREFGL